MNQSARKRGFTGFWMPVEIIECTGLTWIQRVLWCEIVALDKGEHGKCFAKNEHFMEMFDLAESTLRKHLTTLRIEGWLDWRHENGMRVLVPLSRDVKDARKIARKPEECSESSKPMLKIEHVVYKESPIVGTKTPIVPATPQDLLILTGEIPSNEPAEEIYKIYPRKAAKPAALKAIRKALKEIPFVTLQRHVRIYAMRVAGKDIEFIPHPATWFNQRRWEDTFHDPEVPRGMTTTGMTPEEAQEF